MARRRLTPAQPGLVVPSAENAGVTPAGSALAGAAPFRAAPIAQVAGQSAEAAALREMAQGIQAAREEGRMIVEVPLEEVQSDFLMRDRIALDRDELDALKASIRAHGQRTPAEIAPLPGAAQQGGATAYGLISGWRRLTALKELYRETSDPRFASLRALIRQSDDGPDSYVAMIEENEVRVGISYYERARIVSELTRRGVFADQGTALRTLFATASRAKRSKIGSFVDVVKVLDDVLRFPSELPERLGLALVARLRAASRQEVAALRKDLARAEPATAAMELGVLEGFCHSGAAKPPAPNRPPAEQITSDLALRLERKGQKITVTLEGEGADEALVARLRQLLNGLSG